MKNFKKLITVLLSTLMIVTMITGCNKKVAPPEEFAKAFYDLAIYVNSDAITSLGMSADEANTVKAEYEKARKDKIRNDLRSGGLQCTDDQINKLYDAQLVAQKKVNCTVETISSDSKTAVVKIKTTHINISGIDESAANAAAKEVQNLNIVDTNIALAKLLELYIVKFEEGCNDTEPSSDTVENTFAFKKVTDDKNRTLWAPEDPVTLGNQVANMINQ
ncbi:DUF5105 domain-containing protein [Clostridium botulinum]|uniref:DUF5105 domain-containing protein n=1 Tax=Clostridium botulinum TaxID=1491 RepID=A0A6B4JNZ7_CLOBO|nr:DUF5105 domain-containing protein [Clostridium botulinum]EES50989.1 putative lipoprotein [Clostridium botulinum E1 str. 'BoNT E Beluga']MBY6761735.1 DUF5105 domain-containing protein [Clostridium botulinum]MBY6920722.1 DUF5105 domain-containing protein [Clostridium botulinum]MCR1131530.1 DUF5105 domain-containing protein [Clostridium botulinum]NFJ58567.1 DUF5105 domain-containing protein [Clostridium botulinum]